MKKLLICIVAGMMVGAASCYKDKGNYSYHEINEISFSQIDTATGYSVFIGDSLKISPRLISSMPGEPQDYNYEWSFFDQIKGDRILSREKDLRIKINEIPGPYTLQYRVTDKSNGRLFHIRTNVLVKTTVYEGYLVLNEVNGKSRLDMLSYDATNGSFTQIPDVLDHMGSNLPQQGKPVKVLASRVTNAFNWSDSTYGIYLLTEDGTNRIHPESFQYNPTYNIRYECVGNIPADFKADNLISDPAFYYINLFLYSNYNVYVRGAGIEMYSLPVNKLEGQLPFRAAPWLVANSSQYLMMYDIDARKFNMLNSINGFTAVPVPVATEAGQLDYPSGRDLVWMEKTTSGYAYAITKDVAGPNFYLTKFIPGSLPVYSKRINGTDIGLATKFTVGTIPEYLFYSAGGKVYEYDLYTESSKLMLNKGASEITYLAFQQFSPNRSPGTYGQWQRWLTLGYSDPGAPEGSNGTLEQYSVPDANEALVLQKKWTGFGNIVSISYRER